MVRLIVTTVYFGNIPPLSSDGLFWVLLFLFLYTISSGWIYYLAFKFLDKDLIKGLKTIAIERLLEGQVEALTQTAIHKAIKGDPVALRLVSGDFWKQ